MCKGSRGQGIPGREPSGCTGDGQREDECSSSAPLLDRRSFLRTSSLIGAGAVLGAGAQPASAHHPECEVADQFIESPNYGVRDQDIDWIVVHVTTGPYQNAINWFENPDSNVSAHYVVKNYDDGDYPPGHVTQMVHEEDSAWHARAIANPRSIGIELEWWADANPAEPISQACYESLAEIVRCVARRYDIPLRFFPNETCILEEDGGIIGHQHVPDTDCTDYNHSGRTCPYPDFNVNHFMSTLQDTFEEGDDVETTAFTSGRTGPGSGYPIVDFLQEGTEARVVDGPVKADDRSIWWRVVRLDSRLAVWCTQENLGLRGVEVPFEEGSVVETNEAVNGYEQPGLDNDVVAFLPKGTKAEVVNGPETADERPWWGLYVPEENVWVWCIQYSLEVPSDEDALSVR